MTAEPIIDVDELVQPIPGDNPGGEPLSDAMKRDLDTWRKEPDPDFPETSVLPPPEWGKVIAAASTVLIRTGKDLTVAVRLVEALAKKYSTVGLRDGLTLLKRLVTDCWDYVHPVPESGDDQEARRNKLEWLNDQGKGGRFPMTVMRLPVVRTVRGEEFTAVDWLTRPEEVQEAEVSADGLRKAFDELTKVREVLRELGTLLDEKMAQESPNLSEDGDGNLGSALLKCVEFVRGLAAYHGYSLDDAPPPEAPPPVTNQDAVGGLPPAATAGSRAQLYSLLAQVAAGLKRIEPHSPIPYLLERCVRLGSLNFPELMREVIHESSTLDELDQLLGLKRD